MDELTIRTVEGLALQGVLRMPDGDVARGGAVVCHSHPLYGGSKDHPLLWALRAALARAGLAVLAFNFRGVMGSEGEHDFGIGEVRDATAAVSFLRERAAGPTLLVGWSFGANVALREALEDPRVDALVLIGTPLAADRLPDLPPMPSAETLAAYRRPVLLLSGERDAFSPQGEVRILGRKFADASVQITAGADHYFAKRERDAAAIVAEFAVERLFGASDT
jgi:alpha/beta superfamily hydrolase